MFYLPTRVAVFMKKTFPCAAARTCNYAFISCHFKGSGIFSSGSSRRGVPCHLSSGEIAGCVSVFEEQVVWLVIPLGEDSSVGRRKEITEQESSSLRSPLSLTASSDSPGRCCYLCSMCILNHPRMKCKVLNCPLPPLAGIGWLVVCSICNNSYHLEV